MTMLTTIRNVACDTGVNPPVANCKVDKSKIAGKDSFQTSGWGVGAHIQSWSGLCRDNMLAFRAQRWISEENVYLILAETRWGVTCRYPCWCKYRKRLYFVYKSLCNLKVYVSLCFQSFVLFFFFFFLKDNKLVVLNGFVLLFFY